MYGKTLGFDQDKWLMGTLMSVLIFSLLLCVFETFCIFYELEKTIHVIAALHTYHLIPKSLPLTTTLESMFTVLPQKGLR